MYTITITITGHWLRDVHGDSFFLFHWNEFRKSSGNLFRQGKKLSFASFTKHNFFILSLNGSLKEYIFWFLLLYFESHQQQKIYLCNIGEKLSFMIFFGEKILLTKTDVKIFEIFSVEAVDHSNRVDQFWRENRNCGEP